MNDSQLIDRALSGDRAAFEELVRANQDRLFATMLQVSGSAAEAEEIIQDAFVCAFAKLHTFQQNSQFFTWLYRIAFNSFLSGRRRRRSEVSVEVLCKSGGGDLKDPSETPDGPMLRDERVRMVHHALGQLSDHHRVILVLREMEGCSYDGIAEILEISIGTVRSRLSRARTELKTAIEEIEASQGSAR